MAITVIGIRRRFFDVFAAIKIRFMHVKPVARLQCKLYLLLGALARRGMHEGRKTVSFSPSEHERLALIR